VEKAPGNGDEYSCRLNTTFRFGRLRRPHGPTMCSASDTALPRQTTWLGTGTSVARFSMPSRKSRTRTRLKDKIGIARFCVHRVRSPVLGLESHASALAASRRPSRLEDMPKAEDVTMDALPHVQVGRVGGMQLSSYFSAQKIVRPTAYASFAGCMLNLVLGLVWDAEQTTL